MLLNPRATQPENRVRKTDRTSKGWRWRETRNCETRLAHHDRPQTHSHDIVHEISRNLYLSKMEVVVQDRRFFITRRGFVGLGPPSTQTGDTVYILQGVRLPYLIRPRQRVYRDNTWAFIGETYVDGITYEQVTVGTLAARTETFVLA